MKKYPRWAFLVAGVVVTVAALYAWGRYNMKKQAKSTGSVTAAPVEATTAAKLAGPVLRP